MKPFKSFSLAIAVAFATMTPAFSADIVDTAVKAGNFKTLAAALDAAGLVQTLKGKGPFTVFAPTDQAFANLPAGTVETLLKPENKHKLSAILTYHVVPAKVKAAQVVTLSGATTVNGQRVDIQTMGSTVNVDDAKVITTDIECDNGVIHVIDSVIIPTEKTIPEVASAAGTFNTLIAAVKAAGLAETLSGAGPFTVFAPTDEAFAKLPAGTIDSLLKPENKQQLVDILTYHVASGRQYSDAVLNAKSVKSLQGSAVNVGVTDSVVKISGANLVKADIDASNGVIHVIDSVIMPPAKTSDARTSLQHAIAQGAPMFNAGHHAACADLYEHTLTNLMSTTPMEVHMRQEMESVLTNARNHSCPTTRAWTLRHGMDKMYSQLSAAH